MKKLLVLATLVCLVSCTVTEVEKESVRLSEDLLKDETGIDLTTPKAS